LQRRKQFGIFILVEAVPKLQLWNNLSFQTLLGLDAVTLELLTKFQKPTQGGNAMSDPDGGGSLPSHRQNSICLWYFL
jgi:hypothetical protein